MATKPKREEVKNKKVVDATRFEMTANEKAVWGMISGKYELAVEKEKSAREIRQTAQMLQNVWVKSLLSSRSIPETERVNIDVDNGVIAVEARDDASKQG